MPNQKPTSPIKSSTQEFVDLEFVKEDIAIFKDNSASIIIACGTTNFGLLSQEEQNAMIYAYSGMLNSLSFPIQILILSKKMDISSYLDYLDLKIKKQNNDNLKTRLINYAEFIKTITKKNTILEKKFYFTIPFSPLELGIEGARNGRINRQYIFTKSKVALYPKKDHLLRLLKKAGLGGHVMYEQEIVELFYNLYNPSPSGRKLAPIDSYTNIISTPKN